MPLRTPNDLDPANIILDALGLVLPGSPVNTVIGTNTPNSVYVNSWASLFGAVYPLLMMEEDAQYSDRVDIRTWQGQFKAMVHYIDRWDRTPLPTDTVWADIDLDLRRMKANLEDNPTLTCIVTANNESSPTRHAQSILKVELSTYRGQINLLAYPFGLVARTMTVTVDLMPYVGAE